MVGSVRLEALPRLILAYFAARDASLPHRERELRGQIEALLGLKESNDGR